MPLAFELDAANLALNILFAGLGIIGILGGAAVYARSSSTKANFELLRGEVADLTASNARKDGENKGLQGENKVLNEQLEKEREDKRVLLAEERERVRILTELATGRRDVEAIADTVRTELRGLATEIRAMVEATTAGGGGGHVPEREGGSPPRR